MPTLLFKSTFDDPKAWLARLREHVPDLELRVWPDIGNVEEIDYALVWKPEPGDLARYPNLKVILSLAAGVDHIFADPDLPDVPVCRIVDRDLIAQLSEYILYFTLRYHRKMPVYEATAREHRWAKHGRCEAALRTVGVLGIGEIGGDAAAKIAALGFPVLGWSRTEKSIPGVESLTGEDGLRRVLEESAILACALPLTPRTEGLFNAETLAHMPEGSYLINVGRGDLVIDDDLIAAVHAKHLAGATLDVLNAEPLPAGHPFWQMPEIAITPHVSGWSLGDGVLDVAENYKRLISDQPL
ncbi:MAG: glyoxylate/hydroxypyruvate reductase A, partial [Rhodospirillaceae bacterium]|nr:glyoxylate/hydroxypyruvate reductase A [Rhodospirillaceae bacterium]